jgi:cytochrome c nitrite reductase small subunit
VPKGLKIIIGALVAVMALGVMGLLVLRDLDRRPDYCASCHVTDQGVASWVNSDYLAYKHAVAGISCQRCHERNVQTLVHEVVNTVLQRTEAPPPGYTLSSAECERCHGGFEGLAKLTTGLARNPHQSPHGTMECSDCHHMHSPSVDACAACHDPLIVGPGWTQPPKTSASAQR